MINGGGFIKAAVDSGRGVISQVTKEIKSRLCHMCGGVVEGCGKVTLQGGSMVG